ncbi:MAG TPA: cytochrome c [Acidimicrobiales bacterium]
MTTTVIAGGLAILAGCGGETAVPAQRDGASLYAASCATCHGRDLRGTPLGPSMLSVVYEPSHHSDESFFAAVRNGVVPHHWNFGPMPPVGGLSDDDITAIIAHVRATQNREGFEPYPPG